MKLTNLICVAALGLTPTIRADDFKVTVKVNTRYITAAGLWHEDVLSLEDDWSLTLLDADTGETLDKIDRKQSYPVFDYSKVLTKPGKQLRIKVRLTEADPVFDDVANLTEWGITADEDLSGLTIYNWEFKRGRFKESVPFRETTKKSNLVQDQLIDPNTGASLDNIQKQIEGIGKGIRPVAEVAASVFIERVVPPQSVAVVHQPENSDQTVKSEPVHKEPIKEKSPARTPAEGATAK